MQQEYYQQVVADAANKLVDIREVVFNAIFQLAMAGELKEWSDAVGVGDSFTFTKDIFEGCDDANIQLLTNLLTQIENTCDSLCNLNNLKRSDTGEDE
jgi:hypothetical protein